MSAKTLIEFNGISKNYLGVHALKGVRFGINEGEIHALIGENGAGKSTLLKIMAGEVTNYEGDLLINNNKASFNHPRDAIASGISLVHQELNLCPNLNVIKNMFLGQEKGHTKDEMLKTTLKYLKKLDLDIDVYKPIKHFTTAQKQLIEIAKAISFQSKILIMDEPTSSLNPIEVASLYRMLRELKESGVTVIFVSHRIEEVMNISDRITVLRDGEYIQTLDKKQTDGNEIVNLMVGRTINYIPNQVDISSNEEVLRVEGLSFEDVFKDISFNLKRGEILGIAGLEGCGRYEVVRAIYGMMPISRGHIHIKNKKIKIKSPEDAIKNKLGFIARERKDEGIFSKMDIKMNISMVVSLKDRLYNERRYQMLADEYVKKLKIKCQDINQLITSLSGGNQQKCIISRWLAEDPEIIIMEEPTRGIDVGSKSEIFKIIRSLADNGSSIIVVSSELSELMNECNRIIVMHQGSIAGEVYPVNTTQEEVMALATGIHEAV